MFNNFIKKEELEKYKRDTEVRYDGFKSGLLDNMTRNMEFFKKEIKEQIQQDIQILRKELEANGQSLGVFINCMKDEFNNRLLFLEINDKTKLLVDEYYRKLDSEYKKIRLEASNALDRVRLGEKIVNKGSIIVEIVEKLERDIIDAERHGDSGENIKKARTELGAYKKLLEIIK